MRRFAAAWLPFVLIGLHLVFSPVASSASLGSQIEAELRLLLEQNPPVEYGEFGRVGVRLHPDLRAFYSARGYSPAWIDDRGEAPFVGVLLDAFRDASAEGLCPEDYHLEPILSLLDQAAPLHRNDLPFDPFRLARLELLLTDGFLWFASDHLIGRAAFAELRQRSGRENGADPVRLLELAMRKGRLKETLIDLLPRHPGYLLLREELARHRMLAVKGGWPEVPEGPVLRPKERDSRVPLLKARLQVTEEGAFLEGEDSELMDEVTVRGLRRFQKRHGLVVDGVLGPRTLAELNVPVEERVRQIELNLERWRWLPKKREKRYLQINIADFSLRLLENEQVVMSMPVVVGSEFRKTPVFSGQMTYLEFAPYWYVPPTILREDKLPLIKRNPAWLFQNHYEIMRWRGEGEPIDPARVNWGKITPETFPGALRQRPGPWNPLGRVKFMFPNRFAIYLHDTPERHLFKRRVRLFSSGCIRIERPLDLAQYLLEEQGMGCDELIDATERQLPLRVDLEQPLPVQILYWTAWVDPDGTMQFRRDYYLRDLDMETALTAWRSMGRNSEQLPEPSESDQSAEGGSQ